MTDVHKIMQTSINPHPSASPIHPHPSNFITLLIYQHLSHFSSINFYHSLFINPHIHSSITSHFSIPFSNVSFPTPYSSCFSSSYFSIFQNLHSLIFFFLFLKIICFLLFFLQPFYSSPSENVFSAATSGSSSSTIDYSDDRHPKIILKLKKNGHSSVSIGTSLAHSLGHLFSLSHSAKEDSIMHPRISSKNSLFIGKESEIDVRKVLGPCQVGACWNILLIGDQLVLAHCRIS